MKKGGDSDHLSVNESLHQYNNFKDFTHKECIGKVYDYLQQIILDFRIKDIKKSLLKCEKFFD